MKQPFEVKHIDSRVVELKLKGPHHKEYVDNTLYSIEFNKNNVIKLGDTIEVTIKYMTQEYSTKYVINYFEQFKSILMAHEFKVNLSTTYVMPLLGFNKDDMFINTNLINCYTSHYDYNHSPGEYLYLIYRYTPTNYYSLFKEAMQKQENFSIYVKDKDERFDCFVFKADLKLVEDVKLLMKGKYSHISKKAKEMIISYHKSNNPENRLNQILHRGHLRIKELEEQLGCKLPKNIDLEEMPNPLNEEWRYSL